MKNELPALRFPSPPWLFKLAAEVANVAEVVRGTIGCEEFLVICLDGRNAITMAEVLDAFGQALEFPDYYGRNFAALEECITDLSWLPATGYVVVFTDASCLLASEPPSELTWLLTFLERVCEAWSHPVALGEAWDRPAIPFHVIFQYESSEVKTLPPQISSLPG